ncbi:MAG: hypothetical protein ACI841_002178 [Planctomycetota bacterium]|jgi:hypothetical protein
MTAFHRLALLLSLPLSGLLACSCGSSESTEPVPDQADPAAIAEQAHAPTMIDVPTPGAPISDLEAVENLTEEVADWLLTLSDKFRKREFSAAEAWFGDDFWGHDIGELALAQTTTDHLDLEQRSYDASAANIVNRPAFMNGWRDRIGAWGRVDSMIWKVKGANFQAGRGTRWGRIKLLVHATGELNGGNIALNSWGWLRVEKPPGQKSWSIKRFQLTSLDEQFRKAQLFTDVSTSTGIAHTGIRFGKPGNQSFSWNGAAAGDVNGDGMWDLFVPSDGRNYFYLAQADGTYSEQAEARGMAQPAMGTGAVFFDFDNDRDQDLAVGHEGWRDADGRLFGHTIQLYENDGEGNFSERSESLGFVEGLSAFSLTVLDYDADGWLDLFVCGYGRVAVEHNNSWIEATNGDVNALYHNVEGKRFKEVAEEAGIAGNSWSYASISADLDRDGHMDLYVANDYGSNQVWLGDGKGSFRNGAHELGLTDRGNGMGINLGDLDGDAKLDVYVSNMSSTAGNRILSRLTEEIDEEVHAQLKKLAAGNSIFLRRDEKFERVPKAAGGIGANWAWSTALADFDLDGRLDVYCANGYVTGDLPFDT